MPTRKSPRKGSLQYWPRKRASKFLPRVNWNAISTGKNLKGFICYKAGMVTAHVKDNTEHSLTKGKKIFIPCTLIECPAMKIFSVRLYKDGTVVKEILATNLDKELKRKLKIPKTTSPKLDGLSSENFDDIKLICYSVVKKTSIKKTPDLSEIGLTGSFDEKLNFVKENLGKELSVENFFEKNQLVDLRGLTKGKGFCGPVKRFGIQLKASKSEKGRRRPGSIGPWHPARVTYKVPMAGQLGMFSRTVYNNKILDMGKAEGKLKPLKNFGEIKTDYILVRGSVQGPAKRVLLATAPLRETKKQNKKNMEVLEIK